GTACDSAIATASAISHPGWCVPIETGLPAGGFTIVFSGYVTLIGANSPWLRGIVESIIEHSCEYVIERVLHWVLHACSHWRVSEPVKSMYSSSRRTSTCACTFTSVLPL